MAKYVSYNKRENEKKKVEKKIKKQQRKEDRKSSGSTDDIYAYVDEYGRITSAPPEKSNEEINLEDICISTPKKEEIEVIRKGIVDYYNTDKGYGFIKNIETSDKYFFHISNAPENIKQGYIVSFDLEKGTQGMNAVNITLAI